MLQSHDSPIPKIASGKADHLLDIYNQACLNAQSQPLSVVVSQLQDAAAHDLPLAACKIKSSPLGKGDVSALAALIRHNPYLTRLDITESHLDDQALGVLLDAVEEFQLLNTLNIQKNTIKGDRSVVSRCLCQMPHLLSLNLSNNDLHSFLGGDVVWSAYKMHLPTCQLQRLNLSNTNLSTASLAALAMGLSKNNTLSWLSLRENKMNTAAVQAIALLLETNTSIRSLDLGCNYAHNTGAAALARALKKNKHLEVLVLWANDFTSTGAVALFEALLINQSLTHLDVGKNMIHTASTSMTTSAVTTTTTSALKRALVTSRSLRTLGLAATHTTQEDAVALAEGLAENKGLQRLDVRANPIGHAGLIAIATALDRNPFLTHIEFDTPSSKDDSGIMAVITKIDGALARNIASPAPPPSPLTTNFASSDFSFPLPPSAANSANTDIPSESSPNSTNSLSTTSSWASTYFQAGLSQLIETGRGKVHNTVDMLVSWQQQSQQQQQQHQQLFPSDHSRQVQPGTSHVPVSTSATNTIAPPKHSTSSASASTLDDLFSLTPTPSTTETPTTLTNVAPAQTHTSDWGAFLSEPPANTTATQSPQSTRGLELESFFEPSNNNQTSTTALEPTLTDVSAAQPGSGFVDLDSLLQLMPTTASAQSQTQQSFSGPSNPKPQSQPVHVVSSSSSTTPSQVLSARITPTHFSPDISFTSSHSPPLPDNILSLNPTPPVVHVEEPPSSESSSSQPHDITDDLFALHIEATSSPANSSSLLRQSTAPMQPSGNATSATPYPPPGSTVPATPLSSTVVARDEAQKVLDDIFGSDDDL